MLFDTEQTMIESVPDSGTLPKAAFQFDWENNRYTLENGSPKELIGVDAVKEWFSQLIRTKTGMRIYPADYGTAAEGFVGKKWQRGYALSELSRTLTESIAYAPFIRSVSDLSFDGSVFRFSVTLETGENFTQEVIPIEP